MRFPFESRTRHISRPFLGIFKAAFFISIYHRMAFGSGSDAGFFCYWIVSRVGRVSWKEICIWDMEE